MTMPLYDALSARAQWDTLRLHMPGHKGKNMAPCLTAAAEIDFTELDGTGNLYTGEGPIAAAEALAARAWGGNQCFFLTGGSTQGVHAGLALCAKCGDTVLLDRNSHKSFFSGMALLDLTPEYIYEPTANSVDAALREHGSIGAVCITSPTYYGVILDVAGIAKVCREHGAFLLVDEAHGAHFPFVGLGACAVGKGAHISVTSTHKTLPALGSSALLFADSCFSPAAVREKMAMFGTSSPSYVILASIDWARSYMTEGGGTAEYARCTKAVEKLRADINARNIFHALSPEDGIVLDPARLTINTGIAGLNGTQAGEILAREFGAYCEMCDRDNIVCIMTCNDTEADFARLETALAGLEKFAGARERRVYPPIPRAARVMSIKSAVFAPRESVPLFGSIGRVAAVGVTPYPPGVPVLAPGERIAQEILDYLTKICYTDTDTISVVKED